MKLCPDSEIAFVNFESLKSCYCETTFSDSSDSFISKLPGDGTKHMSYLHPFSLVLNCSKFILLTT